MPDDIPMPEPIDRLRAVFTEACIRTSRSSRLEERLRSLQADAAEVRCTRDSGECVAMAVLLDKAGFDMLAVNTALKHEFGCAEVHQYAANVWIIAAPLDNMVRIREKVDRMVDPALNVLVLALCNRHSVSVSKERVGLVEMLKRYEVKV